MNNNFLPYQLKKNSEQANTLATQLAQNASLHVNLMNYNADPTGVADSTSAFAQAVAYANSITKVTSLPVSIVIPAGTYRIIKTADMTIPSLICLGGYATIVVEDAYSFLITSNFTMSNINVVSKNTYAYTDSTSKAIFRAPNTADNVSFNNVTFDSVLSASDGTVRASYAIQMKTVTNFKLNNITVKGYRQGISTDGLSNNVKGNNLHFENVELPLYMHGSDPTVTDENYAKNFQFSNITHINTSAQATKYFKQTGSDTFLFEKCDTIEITNVLSEYPVERACYMSACRNAVCHGWNLKNALGIKFVGGSKLSVGRNTIAYNCRISNVHSKTDDIADTYIAEFYWAQDLSVKNCTMNGNNIGDSLVSTRHYISNLLIENCYGENLKRAFFNWQYVGMIDNPPVTGVLGPEDIADGDYTAGLNGLIIRNNTIKNCNTLDYHIVKISDSLLPAAGTYRYQNITIANNRINNTTDNYGLTPGSTCKGIIDIDSVQNLRIEDNRIYGYYRTDSNGNELSLPFQIGSNSKNVLIKHKETVRNTDFRYNFGNIYVSADTEITINTITRLMSYQDTSVITLKHDTTDTSNTKNLSTAFRITGKMSLSNVTDFSLPAIGGNIAGYTIPALFGTVDISTDAGDIGGYIVTGAGAVSIKANSTALFVTSTTDTKFAFFKDGSLPRYLLRYKNAPSASFIINYTLQSA